MSGEGDSWHRWEQLQALCGHHSKLGVILEVGENLPPPAEIQRWLGEPLRAVALPTSVFLTNKRGYPTLSKPHQDLLLLFFRHGVQVSHLLCHILSLVLLDGQRNKAAAVLLCAGESQPWQPGTVMLCASKLFTASKNMCYELCIEGGS